MIPRLFIVDDEAPARARLITLLSDIAEQCPHHLAGTASHAQDALDEIVRTRPDIVLLDVQMPGMTGLELASHLSSELTGAPSIIFISAHDEYALKAFDVHALDYLLKPVRAARLAEAIQRVSALRGQLPLQKDAITDTAVALRMKRQHFSVQERGRLLLVPVTDVIYLKAELKYVTLRTKMRDYLIEASLLSIEEEFGAVFVRVHRNALVARKAIIGVERGSQTVDPEGENEKAQESWQVILRDVDDRLPISRRQWTVIKALVR
ncbi:MAG: DNA-binding response regulator [Burkholderiales bacterium RIFCSPLOWO2_02_FULL_57_36]|nr:MAG: DNA-binding response regulator [Burkholderiales bacterium RIFCSPLOWO2_02_FULL_57_36]